MSTKNFIEEDILAIRKTEDDRKYLRKSENFGNLGKIHKSYAADMRASYSSKPLRTSIKKFDKMKKQRIFKNLKKKFKLGGKKSFFKKKDIKVVLKGDRIGRKGSNPKFGSKLKMKIKRVVTEKSKSRTRKKAVLKKRLRNSKIRTKASHLKLSSVIKRSNLGRKIRKDLSKKQMKAKLIQNCWRRYRKSKGKNSKKSSRNSRNSVLEGSKLDNHISLMRKPDFTPSSIQQISLDKGSLLSKMKLSKESKESLKISNTVSGIKLKQITLMSHLSNNPKSLRTSPSKRAKQRGYKDISKGSSKSGNIENFENFAFNQIKMWEKYLSSLDKKAGEFNRLGMSKNINEFKKKGKESIKILKSAVETMKVKDSSPDIDEAGKGQCYLEYGIRKNKSIERQNSNQSSRIIKKSERTEKWIKPEENVLRMVNKYISEESRRFSDIVSFDERECAKGSISMDGIHLPLVSFKNKKSKSGMDQRVDGDNEAEEGLSAGKNGETDNSIIIMDDEIKEPIDPEYRSVEKEKKSPAARKKISPIMNKLGSLIQNPRKIEMVISPIKKEAEEREAYMRELDEKVALLLSSNESENKIEINYEGVGDNNRSASTIKSDTIQKCLADDYNKDIKFDLDWPKIRKSLDKNEEPLTMLDNSAEKKGDSSSSVDFGGDLSEIKKQIEIKDAFYCYDEGALESIKEDESQKEFSSHKKNQKKEKMESAKKSEASKVMGVFGDKLKIKSVETKVTIQDKKEEEERLVGKITDSLLEALIIETLIDPGMKKILSRKPTEKKIPKEVDMQKVVHYTNFFITKVLKSTEVKREILDNLNSSIGPNNLQKVRLNSPPFMPTEESKVEVFAYKPILDISLYIEIEELLKETLYKEKKLSREEIEYMHILHKLVYDSLNEMLDFKRFHGIKGTPFKFKTNYKEPEQLGSLGQVEEILEESKVKIFEMCSYRAGVLREKEPGLANLANGKGIEILREELCKKILSDFVRNSLTLGP